MFQAQRLFDRDLSGLRACLSEWQADFPRMGVLVYLPEAQAAWVAELQACCRTLGVPLVGAVFPALITQDGFVTEGAWVIRFDTMPLHGLVGGLSADAPVSARRLVSEMGEVLASAAEPGAIAYMVFDAMLPHIGSLMTDVAKVFAERLHTVGMNAGSETFQPMPCLFDGDRCVGNAALCLSLPAPKGLAVEHGYPVSNTLMKASSAHGNRIDAI